MHFYTRMQARQQHYFSILPFCWSIWSLCTCYFSFLYGIVKQENYILLSLIKTCTHGILWGGKTNTVATTTICYKNQTPLLNIKYNTWMRILHERYVHRLYDQSLSINMPFRVHPKLIGVHRSLNVDLSGTHQRLIGDWECKIIIKLTQLYGRKRWEHSWPQWYPWSSKSPSWKLLDEAQIPDPPSKKNKDIHQS